MPWTVADVEQHKSGLTVAQKRQWVAIANPALARCEARNGSNCEASAIRQANSVVGNNSVGEEMKNENQYTIHLNRYSLRTETHQGQPHIVVPVVMMVEGVHRGTHGPILHLAEELGKFVKSWNGIPITIQHKSTDPSGTANTPDVIDEHAVGTVFNAVMDGNKLKAEAWIEESRISRLSREALEHITQEKPLEVSIGVFSDDEERSGTWRGERYIGVARDYRPDHLALLPGGEGACSWDDGCGVRTNKKGGDTSVKDLFNVFKELAKEGLSVININQEGFREIMTAIRSKLDQMDNDIKVYFLEEVFDENFIYRVQSREDGAGGPVLFKRGYQVNEDSGVDFTGDPIPVIRKVEYVERQTNTFSRMKGVKMAEGDKDKSLATNQGECAQKVEAMLNEREEKKVEEQKVQESVKTKEELDSLKDSLADSDKALEVLSGEAKERLEYGVKAHKEEKDGIIEKIFAVNSEAFSKEELEAKSLDDLQKLSSLLPEEKEENKARNFSGQGAGDKGVSTHSKSTSGGMLVPVDVGVEKSKA